MKALVKFKRGSGNIKIQEVPEPKVGAEEVKIKVKACGICGTERSRDYQNPARGLGPHYGSRPYRSFGSSTG